MSAARRSSVVDKSLRLRRKKALDRMRGIRQQAKGGLRREQVSLAAAVAPGWHKTPLIFRGHIPEDEDEDQPA